METEFAADDYVTFQILPENRYEAYISSSEKEEMVGHGPLDQLLEHLPSIKEQISKGSLDDFRLLLPNTNDDRWFSKATLSRFLHMIGSSDLKKASAISNEMSQLEEARKFHLSLYTKVEKGITSSDTSKNELLRAMDSRLAALTEELASAVNLSAGATVAIQEMGNLQNCCQHFGDEKTRNLISKLSERSQKSGVDDSSEKPKPSIPFVSKTDYASKSAGNPQESTPVKAVKYNASPAKAAEMERQSSTDSDASSFSSEDDDPPAERSRTMARSASPRRSASPMRKVQIGRAGSRRTPALAIKSLPYFPPRIATCKDAGNDTDVDVAEEPVKKTEVNVTRISVQDAISLFERKQKDDIVDSQKKSTNDSSVNKAAVLRRWSSGMGESRKSFIQDKPENTTSENKGNSLEEDAVRPAEATPDTDRVCEDQNLDGTMGDDMESKGNVEVELNLEVDDGQGCQTDDTGEKIDSVEWTRQKEAELNQMLMKFAQYNLSNPKSTESDNVKNHGSCLPQKGKVDRKRKEGTDVKLKADTTGKNVEKQTELKPKKKVLGKPKVEKSSPKVSDVGRRSSTGKIPNVNTASRVPNLAKNTSTSSNTKKESPKPDVLKRALPKPSPLPATRKSWPSTPSPRALGTVPAKISTGPPSGNSASRSKSQLPGSSQKSQPLVSRQKPQSPVLRSSPKTQTTQLNQKDVKKAQVDTKKSTRKVDDSKTRVPSKSGKTMKTKAAVVVEEGAAVSPVKAIVRKKGTKKSSVVPLEAKPPSRKASGTTPASSPLKMTEISVQSEETLNECENPVGTPVKAGTVTADAAHTLEAVQESEQRNDDFQLERESTIEQPVNDNERVISTEAHVQDDEPTERMLGSPGEIQSEQEPVISPAAWEETNQLDPTIPTGNGSSPPPANHDVVASSGTRVRHSLSQMLLEESTEPDIIEWGNAENPPAMIYQKDAPKGLKRLLKFTRKNKGETNGSTWASPYTSEGEDDGDEYKSLGKRHSDNLLKVALHSRNNGEGCLSDTEPLSARSNASNSSARSSSRFQDGHNSKGTRSFFSLSAFRGNKS
ncbi:hypothetical protein vseg_008789 [Gypsophila vaccaria]